MKLLLVIIEGQLYLTGILAIFVAELIRACFFRIPRSMAAPRNRVILPRVWRPGACS